MIFIFDYPMHYRVVFYESWMPRMEKRRDKVLEM